MSSNRAIVKITFDRVMALSNDAMGINIDSECYWLPLSLIEERSGTVFGDEERYVKIPLWLAVNKGLDKYIDEEDD